LSTRFDTATGAVGGESRALTLTVDNQVSTPSIAWKIDSGIVGDNITHDATTSLVGTAELGATVRIDVSQQGALVHSESLFASGTTFEVLTSKLGLSSEGQYEVTLQQTDLAGNTSPLSVSKTLIVDQTAPVLTIEPGDAWLSATEVASLVLNYTLDDTAAQLSFSLQGSSNPIPAVSWNASPTRVGANLSSLPEGNYHLTITATDVAGNEAKVVREFVVDKTAPTLYMPTINGLGLATVINRAMKLDEEVVLTGTVDNAESGQAVTVTLSNATQSFFATGLHPQQWRVFGRAHAGLPCSVVRRDLHPVGAGDGPRR